jgi:hypothetical protein
MPNIAVYVLVTTGILNLVGIAGLFYRMSIMSYQHKLMWNDFARRKGLNGHAAVGMYAGANSGGEDTSGADRSEAR